MSAKALVNEFAKMRHLRIWLLTLILAVLVIGIGLYGSAMLGPDFDPSSAGAWNSVLSASGFTLAGPLLLAVIASRQVDIEHQGNGWLMSATSGLTSGGLCRAKLLALGLLVTTATITVSAALLAVGLLFGVTAPIPAGRWIGFTACIVVVNLVILALHIVLSTRFENQLVGIGIGLLGTVLALFGNEIPTWMAHLTPWGYYALSTAAEYQNGALVGLTPSYASILGLGVVAATVFILFTGRLDRQEV
ncbi:ABC transporter permease [Brachybacterium paraconglomeratum]|uniref:ABC transporter permease n=1 Tax=Brachybacterium paraconglomeratum TaxID=173362 RepID=UPI003FD0F155